MNKKNLAVIGLSFLCCAISCNNHKEPDYDPSIVTPLKENSKTDTALNVPADTTSNAQTQNSVAVNTAPAQPVTVAAGMNPAHGQPGHRCDIAVGAPLNSPPGNTKPVTQTATPSTNIKTAPGMNPAHGQPGHRCDIAVGAPLNSPIKATTTPATQTVSPETKPAAPAPAMPKDAPTAVPASSNETAEPAKKIN